MIQKQFTLLFKFNAFVFTLNPVGDQSTNAIDFFDFMFAIALLTSVGTTSPLYNKQHDMYFPAVGLHLTI